jgi:hypothetical protein
MRNKHCFEGDEFSNAEYIGEVRNYSDNEADIKDKGCECEDSLFENSI